MRGVVVVLAVAACRPPPPEPLPREPEIEHVEPQKPVRAATKNVVLADSVLMPRPDIDLSDMPDPTHELRWPLSMASHPELEPQFEIARALAEPGVGWLDLCRLGAHNRHLGKDKRDHVAYLRGWCSVGKQDFDAALAHLVPLASSVVLGLAPAVRADFANIVISSGDANDATRLLAKHRIKDIAVLDTIAASYVELGRLDDAYQINELAITTDDRKNHANRCKRLTRRLVLRPPAKHLKAIDLPNAGLFDVPDGADATCTRLEHELSCWLDPVSGCDHYFVEHKFGIPKSSLVIAYYLWPSGGTGSWFGVANNARLGIPLPGAARLAIAGLFNDLRTTACESTHIKDIIDLARSIRAEVRDAVLDAQLAQIIDQHHVLCFAR